MTAPIRSGEAARAMMNSAPPADSTARRDEMEDFAPIEPIDAVDLIAAHPRLREPVIHGLLRRGEVLNVIGCPKSMKSYLVTDLSLCLAVGGRWLNRFDAPAGRVLLIDNELHAETLAHRIPAIAAARSIILERGRIDVIPLRGRLRNLFQLAPVFETAAEKYHLVIFDALYRLLPDDSEENANTGRQGLTAVYNQLDYYAGVTNAAIAVIHHATKGSQSDKRVTDVGAGAGAQSRACDSHLIIREHADPDAVVVDAVVRSWPPPESFAMRWTYPVWTPDDALDPSKLKPVGRRNKPKSEAESLADLLKFTADCLSEKPVGKETLEDTARSKGWTVRDFRSLLDRGIDADLIEVRIEKHGRKVYRRREGGNGQV